MEFELVRKIVLEEVGSYGNLAKLCGVSKSVVFYWMCKIRRMPSSDYTGKTNYAELIASKCNGRIKPGDLTPKG